MLLEEAFDEETAAEIKKGIVERRPESQDALDVVLRGLKEIVTLLENGKSP